jgi:hypothetical protein
VQREQGEHRDPEYRDGDHHFEEGEAGSFSDPLPPREVGATAPDEVAIAAGALNPQPLPLKGKGERTNNRIRLPRIGENCDSLVAVFL